MNRIIEIFVATSLIVFFSFSSIKAQKTGVELAGDVIQIALPAAAFTSTIIWQGDDKPHWQFVKTMAVSVVVTHSAKHIINKQRPNGGNYSFPSGHTSAAFTGAAFIQKRYGWNAGIPCYVLASFVGWSRVYANKHDYWDVLGGAVVGIGSAYLFTKKYQKNDLQLAFSRQNGNNVFSLAVTF
jgi:membrane-associated phospholipid phosphatase